MTTATVVGLLTGFGGVGGGFLVVPALPLALVLPMEYAAGTSLVVITLTSAVALAVRTGVGSAPRLGPGARAHRRIRTRRIPRRQSGRPHRHQQALGLCFLGFPHPCHTVSAECRFPSGFP